MPKTPLSSNSSSSKWFAPTISYGNFEFIESNGYPTPTPSISYKMNKTAAQGYLSQTKTITLNGVVYTDHKRYSSTPNAYNPLVTLQKAIALKSGLLLNNLPTPLNHELQILKIWCRSAGGAPDIIISSGYAVIDSMNFDTDADPSLTTIPYSISFTEYAFDEHNMNKSGISMLHTPLDRQYLVSSIEDSIDITPNFDKKYTITSTENLNTTIFWPTYTITHSLSAVGLPSLSGALYEAAKWINSRGREALSTLSGILPIDINIQPIKLYNLDRTVDISDTQGSITVRDTFMMKPFGDPNNFIDSCTISETVDDAFNRTIDIKGQIEGLQPLDLSYITGNIFSYSNFDGHAIRYGKNTIRPLYSGIYKSNKYFEALSGYQQITGLMFSRASNMDNVFRQIIPNSRYHNQFATNFPNYSSTALHPIPVSITEGLNPINGTIDYAYTYNNRPLALISGALTESFSIDDTGPTFITSNISVIGRRLGPIAYFAAPNYKSNGERTVTYDGIFNSPTGIKGIQFDQAILDSINSLVDTYKPQSPYTGILTSDTSTITLSESRVVRTKTWKYTKCSDR
jgi:hypothetical protein